MFGRFAGSEMPQFLVAALSLGLVLGLIGALSWLARRMPAWLPASPQPMPAPSAALLLRSTLRLDARRRLHLVEAGGRQALILTGGATDVIVCLPPPGA